MGVVPKTRLGKIEFYEAHLDAWTASATAIGLSATQVTALGQLVATARQAFDDAEAARVAARSATQAFYDAVRAMHHGPGAGQDMIDTIRNRAESTNDPNVYVLAQIPAPATPGAVPPPGTPFGFSVSLLQNGAINIKWKCNNPGGAGGTLYEVKRQSGGPGNPFAFIGASGTRSFLDDSLATGAAPVTYQITAVRSTTRGNLAQFTVNFGVGGPGLTIAGLSPTGPVPIAA